MGKAPDNLSPNLPQKPERETGFLKELEIGKSYEDNQRRLFTVTAITDDEYICMRFILQGKSRVRQEEMRIQKKSILNLEINEFLVK